MSPSSTRDRPARSACPNNRSIGFGPATVTIAAGACSQSPRQGLRSQAEGISPRST